MCVLTRSLKNGDELAVLLILGFFWQGQYTMIMFHSIQRIGNYILSIGEPFYYLTCSLRSTMLGMRANYCSSIVTISKEIYVQWATLPFVFV